MNKQHINSTMSKYWAKKPIVVETPLGKGVSVVFSWQIDKAKELAKKEGLELIGGPGAILSGLEVPKLDVTLIDQHNPYATFTTRGCPNCCDFCAVPIIEGEFRELPEWKPNPLICDNNILACSEDHFRKVIDSVVPFGWVDFNQGLDSHLLREFHLEELKKHIKKAIIRLSFDNIDNKDSFVKAVEMTKKFGFRDIRCYVLIGHHDTPKDALYRLRLCQELKVTPNPMRYQPVDIKVKNSYIDSSWTEDEIKKMMRYFAVLRKTSKIPYEEFDNTRGRIKVIKNKEVSMPKKIEEPKRKPRKFHKKDTLFDFSKYQVSRELLEKFCERVSETRKKLEEEILSKISELDLSKK